MKVGDEITVKTERLDVNANKVTRYERAKVCFVNKRHGYFTVEYAGGRRESFRMGRPVAEK